MRKREGHIIWPAYFEKKYSRGRGRRVPQRYAVEDVSLDMVVKAVQSLGYPFSVERDKKYPPFWWESRGRLIVKANISKSKLIKQIAAKLKSLSSKKS